MNIRILKYLSVYLNFLFMGLSLVWGGVWLFLIPFYLFILIPVLELLFAGSDENMSKAEEELAKQDKAYDFILWCVPVLQWALLFLFLNRVADNSLRAWEVAGLVLVYGVSCGVHGINAAHELGHRNTWYEQFMSKMLLATSFYMHFYIEHNRGHHKNVSTDEDPASAKAGESLYRFWVRTIFYSWLSAWHLERDRLRKDNQSFWGIHNEMLVIQILNLVMLTGITIVWGWKVTLCYLASSLIGICLLETVNYIEHYGLRRKKIDNAYYDKTHVAHSWNSNHPIGRMMLFELSRHSDHHYQPNRKYQLLRNPEKSPQMPTGYPGMIMLALMPPAWFYIMDREIKKYRATEYGELLA